MATYRELMSRVDMLLGAPHPNAPSEPIRFEHFRTVLQHVTNVALNAAPSWITNKLDLPVVDGTEIYTITAPDFGKPLLVETCDPSDIYHQPRQIAMSSWASELMVSDGISQNPGWTSSNSGLVHTARVMAFRREPGVVYVRVLPKPSISALYRIYYETSGVNDSSLDNQLFMPYGESYLVAATALALLPECKWSDLDNTGNAAKRADKFKTLSIMTAQLEREHRRILATDKQQGKLQAVGFDDASYLADQNG